MFLLSFEAEKEKASFVMSSLSSFFSILCGPGYFIGHSLIPQVFHHFISIFFQKWHLNPFET